MITDINKKTSNEDELERLQKQLKQEQLLKMQAVNKLAEIMNRKELNVTGGKRKASSADLRRKEKECRKLQQELTQVFYIIFSGYRYFIFLTRYALHFMVKEKYTFILDRSFMHHLNKISSFVYRIRCSRHR